MNEDFSNLFNDDMDDEEFRKLFTRIMNQKQKRMENFLKMFYGGNFLDLPSSSSFGGFGLSSPWRTSSGKTEGGDEIFDMFKNMFGNGIDSYKSETDEDGWETRSWSTPDGVNFSSSVRVFRDPEEFEKMFNNKSNEDPIGVLEVKLKKAIEEERYEDAANFRDAIKSLKSESKKDNEKKSGK